MNRIFSSPGAAFVVFPKLFVYRRAPVCTGNSWFSFQMEQVQTRVAQARTDWNKRVLRSSRSPRLGRYGWVHSRNWDPYLEMYTLKCDHTICNWVWLHFNLWSLQVLNLPASPSPPRLVWSLRERILEHLALVGSWNPTDPVWVQGFLSPIAGCEMCLLNSLVYILP